MTEKINHPLLPYAVLYTAGGLIMIGIIVWNLL
jgi:hypothetical protein